MYGELNEREVDALLERQRYGRLGFTLDGQLYIIPINYGYAGGVLYGHASEGSHLYGHGTQGTKVRGMRKNPVVAFEVDEIVDPAIGAVFCCTAGMWSCTTLMSRKRRSATSSARPVVESGAR